MALRDTLVGRLIVAIQVLRPSEELDLIEDSELGSPPIGWDDFTIRQDFLEVLRDDKTGFTDIVRPETPLIPSDMGRGTSLGALANTVIRKSSAPGARIHHRFRGEVLRPRGSTT